MIIEDLLTYAGTSGLGTVGTDLFIGVAPANAGNCTMFIAAGGSIDGDTPELRDVSFQVSTRNSDYQAGWNKINALRNGLIIRQQVVGSSWVYYCLPSQEPLSLGAEASGFFIFVVNFDARWRLN